MCITIYNLYEYERTTDQELVRTRLWHFQIRATRLWNRNILMVWNTHICRTFQSFSAFNIMRLYEKHSNLWGENWSLYFRCELLQALTILSLFQRLVTKGNGKALLPSQHHHHFFTPISDVRLHTVTRTNNPLITSGVAWRGIFFHVWPY